MEPFPLSDFHNIWYGEGVPDPHQHAKFHFCGFKNVGLQLPKLPNFISPYAIFTNCGVGEGVLRPNPHPHAKLQHCGFNK